MSRLTEAQARVSMNQRQRELARARVAPRSALEEARRDLDRADLNLRAIGMLNVNGRTPAELVQIDQAIAKALREYNAALARYERLRYAAMEVSR